VSILFKLCRENFGFFFPDTVYFGSSENTRLKKSLFVVYVTFAKHITTCTFVTPPGTQVLLQDPRICLRPNLNTRVEIEISRSRDATELNNDGMIKLGDVHYQTEANLSFFS